jgi:hypothetical protein
VNLEDRPVVNHLDVPHSVHAYNHWCATLRSRRKYVTMVLLFISCMGSIVRPEWHGRAEEAVLFQLAVALGRVWTCAGWVLQFTCTFVPTPEQMRSILQLNDG